VSVTLLQSGVVSALLAKPANDLAALQNVITALTTKPNITMPSLSIAMPDLVRENGPFFSHHAQTEHHNHTSAVSRLSTLQLLHLISCPVCSFMYAFTRASF
jgi:hypothetical protein